MSRIAGMFARLHERGERALIPYIPVGYPTAEGSESLIRVIAKSGADLIELGVPYADPLADRHHSGSQFNCGQERNPVVHLFGHGSFAEGWWFGSTHCFDGLLQLLSCLWIGKTCCRCMFCGN